MTETGDLGEQLNHLRHVHSTMATNATTDTMIGVSWILLDYMLWIIDHKLMPAAPYKPKMDRSDREELKTLLDMISRDTQRVTVLLRSALEDLDTAEATIRGGGS